MVAFEPGDGNDIVPPVGTGSGIKKFTPGADVGALGFNGSGGI